jgi:hypothetical protein
MKEKSEDFLQGQCINQSSTAEFDKTKVRHKVGTSSAQSVASCDVKATLIQTPLRSCTKLKSTFVSRPYIKLAMHAYCD